MLSEAELYKETIFNGFEKYNTINKYKSFIISKIKELERNSSQDLFNNIKKNIIPYLMEKKELKVRYNTNEYNIDLINKDIYSESEQKVIQDNELQDNISECSTEDNYHIENNNNIEDNNSDIDIKNENQTYLVEPDDSDEESLIQNAIELTKKNLEKLTVNDLRDIMREKKLTLSKNGTYYTKNEMIKKLVKLSSL